MKKSILTIVVILLVNISSFSQWTEQFYVDDFGEPTTKSYKSLIAKGTFSNSATQNSLLLTKIIDDESAKHFSFQLYEYGSRLATSTENTYEKIKIKTPNGDIVEINRVFFEKKGSLYLWDENYTKIKEALKDKGNYIIIFSKTGSYSESSYKINLTL